MILINSANFQLADVDLSKEIFFVGDNVAGKTTTTRAIHFLYNGNGNKLGITRNQNSFAKHYFPYDDSYIIYIFEDFFIFTYKRNDTIKRWFSKQEFNINEVIKNGKLLDFKMIIEYINQATLKVRPSSIQEYTDILYGKSREYLDFSIAKIDNYKIFLEVFDMIFNIDKAIVTAVDIKKAIQKSLDRKDEVLSIDYDDFIKKLNEFSRAYNFFKIFDSNRSNLSNALILKDNLLSKEDKIATISKAINYKSKIEIKEFNELNLEKANLKLKIDTYKTKLKKINSFYQHFEKRLKSKISILDKNIIKLDNLKEKFDSLEIEKNIELASKFNGIKIELDNKKFDLKKLQEDLSSSQKIIENQIEQLKYKIKVSIPNEMTKKLFDLSEIEKHNYEEEKLLIDNEYGQLEDALNKEIESLENQILKIKKDIEDIGNKISEQIKTLRFEASKQIKILRSNLKLENSEIDNLEKSLRKLRNEKDFKHNDLRKHQNKYTELRKSNCKSLLNTRRTLNLKIKNAKAILNPIANSFNEFLSKEIEDWESTIYPILDKKLLLKSCDELKPKKLDTDISLGFKVDISNLEKIPTKDEAIIIIKKAKTEKFQALKNSKSVYKDEVSKLNELENEIIANIESIDLQIKNIIEMISKHNTNIATIEEKLEDLDNNLDKDISEVYNKYQDQQNEIEKSKKDLETKINEKKNKDLVSLRRKRVDAIDKRAKDRDKNISIVEKQILQEKDTIIKKLNEEIATLKNNIKNNEENEFIIKLSSTVEKLQENYNHAYDAKKYLEEYEQQKDKILELPLKERDRTKLHLLIESRENLLSKIDSLIESKINIISINIEQLSTKLDKYEKGIKKYKLLQFSSEGEEIETEEFLYDLIVKLEDETRDYENKKSKFRTLLDKLKKLEKHSLIDIHFNNEIFDEVSSIKELNSILESLDELEQFEKNKYDSEKKRRHNNFDTFLKNTIPSKLQSFDDLEMDFEKAKNSINKSLSEADFKVIKDIRLDTNTSKKTNDSIASLMQLLSTKVTDTVKLYSKESLFYYDVPKSVDNINDIQQILEDIKQKGSNGMINLFDTIDLTISYKENGKKLENKQNIKDDSSSGGNILLKVAIAMSILNRYAKKTNTDTPFFLIIDEVSKLQSKNQNLIKEYINSNGFKTLFITPDPAYPDPDRAIYYTFKNIQEDGGNLEIRQMNIV